MDSQSGFNPLNCSRAALQHVGYFANALAVIQRYRDAVTKVCIHLTAFVRTRLR